MWTADTADWLLFIKDFQFKTKRIIYEYDMGDSWSHKITIEKILDAKPDTKYPICIDGKMACPPEDVGGSSGYMDFCKIIKDPKHKEYDEMMKWVGYPFDPADFDV